MHSYFSFVYDKTFILNTGGSCIKQINKKKMKFYELTWIICVLGFTTSYLIDDCKYMKKKSGF